MEPLPPRSPRGEQEEEPAFNAHDNSKVHLPIEVELDVGDVLGHDDRWSVSISTIRQSVDPIKNQQVLNTRNACYVYTMLASNATPMWHS